MRHPCLSCGACCASYRVAFHWAEADPALGGLVPAERVVRWDAHRLAMRGTDRNDPRCVALLGSIGSDAHCAIYVQRPSPCRELAPAWEHGEPSPQCDRARQRHGMAPLRPADWEAFARASAGPADGAAPAGATGGSAG